MGVEVATLEVAEHQHGVFTRRQALSLGLTGRRIRYLLQLGTLEVVFPKVYRPAGAPLTWRQRLLAALLWAGPRSVLSHRCAAALWGFARFGEEPPELTSAKWLAPVGVRTHLAPPLSTGEVRVVDGLKVTSPTRTLVDLGAVTPRSDLRATVEEALRRKLTTLEALEAALARAGPRRGSRPVRRVLLELAGAGGPTESELEARVTDLLASHGFPLPRRQVRVRPRGRHARLDFIIPGTRVAIEADGYAFHATVSAFESDRRRYNALTAGGYRVLQWTWKALEERPHQLIDELRVTLALRE